MVLYKKKLMLGLLAGLFMCQPQAAFAGRVWDDYKAPFGSNEGLVRGVYGGVVGALLGGAAGGAVKGGTAAWIAGFLGALTGALVGKKSADKNDPSIWLQQFSEAFNDLERSQMLRSGDAWLGGYTLPAGAESLRCVLASLSQRVGRLSSVALVLAAVPKLKESVRSELARKLEKINKWRLLCEQRYSFVSAIADLQAFNALYDVVVQARILQSNSTNDSWMMVDGRKFSYSELEASLGHVGDSLSQAKTIANRFLADGYRGVVTSEDRDSVISRLETLKNFESTHVLRTNFVCARVKFERFSVAYERINFAMTRDERAVDVEELLRRRERMPLDVVLRHLDAVSADLVSAVGIGDFLLSESAAQHLTADELSVVAAKNLSLKDYRVLCARRQQLVRALRKIESFDAQYIAAMQPAFVRSSVSGVNDLTWMEIPSNVRAALGAVRWPLQELHAKLETSQFALLALSQSGSELLRDSDVAVLSDSLKSSFVSKLVDLQKSLNLVAERLLFLRGSTMYAQEIKMKLEYEEMQRELARQQRELRKLERERQARIQREYQELQRQQEAMRYEQERLLREREVQQRDLERLDLEQQRLAQERASFQRVDVPKQAPGKVANPGPVAAQKIVSAPLDVFAQSLEACFCGDDIPADKMYVLNCSCKNSFYHRDCINKWVRDSKTCPTCRVRVALGDVKPFVKQGSSNSAKPVVPVRPVVAQASVAVPAQTEECYLCLDADNVADCSTGNCDCTVKKAACRACLQDWLNRNHTCPNCRKAGAIIVPFRS